MGADAPRPLRVFDLAAPLPGYGPKATGAFRNRKRPAGIRPLLEAPPVLNVCLMPCAGPRRQEHPYGRIDGAEIRGWCVAVDRSGLAACGPRFAVQLPSGLGLALDSAARDRLRAELCQRIAAESFDRILVGPAPASVFGHPWPAMPMGPLAEFHPRRHRISGCAATPPGFGGDGALGSSQAVGWFLCHCTVHPRETVKLGHGLPESGATPAGSQRSELSALPPPGGRRRWLLRPPCFQAPG